MCDLIDLDNSAGSPLNTKLASPLIPVPSNIEQRNLHVFNDRNTLIVERRESLDNPFDMVLHEAIEYVRKREDPFEIVFEKALKKDETVISENKDVNITDDLKATYTQFSQKLKESKTLDESLLNPDLVKPNIESKSMNSSILNLSAMSDTLYETNCNTEESEIKCMVQQKIPLHTQTTENNVENILIDIKSVLPKYTRSHSQGDMMQECRQCFKHRSSSAIETLKTGKISTSDPDSLSSLGYNDPLNKGFLQDQYSDNSVFSTLSNISNITRLNSTSLTCHSVPSTMSNNTMNRAFLDSRTPELFFDAKVNGRINNTMNTESVSSETSLPTTPVQTQIDISVLAQKLNDVKMKLSKSQIMQVENNESDYISRQILNNTDPCFKNTNIKKTLDINDKLLDVDAFIPEVTFSKASSDGSSDSIFLENSKANKSILDEAKALARTFEEFAQRVSGSSLDEFIINDPMWTSELLPAFEDEIVDDLIELPSSPNIIKNTIQTNKEGSSNGVLSHKSNTQNNCNNIKSQNNITKEIEVSPVSPIVVEKKVASTLLLDLKKVVKTENNSEANRLLENLEKVLGIRSNKNIELLPTYLQTTNSPNKGHENYETRSEIIKNIEDKTYVSKDHVDDAENYKTEINEDLHHNNKINNEVHNEVKNEVHTEVGNEVHSGSDKLMIARNEVQNDLPLANENTEASPKKEQSSVCVEKKENDVSITHSIHTNINKNEEHSNDTESNEKVAVELLINLGKVLSGQSEKSATLNLLKNLGEVLHLVSKNKQEKNNKHDDAFYTNTERIAGKDKLKTDKKIQSLMSLQSNQRCLDLISKAKTSNEKMLRRSMSVTSTPPNKTLQSTSVFKDNSKCQLKETRKRFPSDPGLINSGSYKNGVAASTGDLRKEVHTTKDIHQVNIETNNQKEKASIKLVVKSQLKNKTKFEVVNRKGPMKAIIPIGNMQRKGVVTPPKSPRNIQPSIKIRSSTPNSMEKGYALKKSPKSKPMASSTPDTPKRKSVLQLPVLQRCDKLNVSCDISPINVQEEITIDKSRLYVSPKRTSKCPSPKRVTPKNRSRESSIPKYSTSPGVRVRYSSHDINGSGQVAEFSLVLSKKEENVHKRSSVICKRIGISQQKSPLKDSNKIITKAKPLNLTCKLRQNEDGSIGNGKENTVSSYSQLK
ncbi:hypothetical protein KPH14_009548 [Odynerus spinipes]|uniref:Uncharacterized protein n=1 Tax=Odynerus spinipes TaxID=1348599 RepID=A0AAD9VQQ3_9HYME|nr:hypothetical protein KPH14_009548 [Odynerus spinipes]